MTQLYPKYWTKIKPVPSRIFKDPNTILDLKNNRVTLVSKDLFSEELVSWFLAKDVVVMNSMAFYRNILLGNTDPGVHQDIDNQEQLIVASVNIELEGNGSMFFYEDKDPTKIRKRSFTSAGTPYINCERSSVSLEDTLAFEKGQTYLVRTEKGHSVSLKTPKRLLLSIRFRRTSDTWEDIVDKLTDGREYESV